MPEINFLAVLVSAIGFMVVGSIWYGPLFGHLWMQGMGWNPDDQAFKDEMKRKAGPAYVQMFIGALITSAILYMIIDVASKGMGVEKSVGGGLATAFWCWVGFILPVIYGKKLWEGKAFKFVAVDLSYQLVAMLSAGVILTLM